MPSNVENEKIDKYQKAGIFIDNYRFYDILVKILILFLIYNLEIFFLRRKNYDKIGKRKRYGTNQ